MVLSWILHVITEDIAESIVFSNTAKDVWDELAQRFSELDGTRLYEVQRSLSSINQGSLSVTAYYTQIKKLWDEYHSMVNIPKCSLGAECASLNALNKFHPRSRATAIYCRTQRIIKTCKRPHPYD